MTYQQQLEDDRESLREQLAIATKPNTIRTGHANGVVGTMARDNAGRIVLVTLDRAAIRLAISELVEAERCLKAHVTDDEIDPPPDTLPSTPTSISSAPPPEEVAFACETGWYEHRLADEGSPEEPTDERIDEIREEP